MLFTVKWQRLASAVDQIFPYLARGAHAVEGAQALLRILAARGGGRLDKEGSVPVLPRAAHLALSRLRTASGSRGSTDEPKHEDLQHTK